MKKFIILLSVIVSGYLLYRYYYKSVLEQDDIDTYSDIDFNKDDHIHLNNI